MRGGGGGDRLGAGEGGGRLGGAGGGDDDASSAARNIAGLQPSNCRVFCGCLLSRPIPLQDWCAHSQQAAFPVASAASTAHTNQHSALYVTQARAAVSPARNTTQPHCLAPLHTYAATLCWRWWSVRGRAKPATAAAPVWTDSTAALSAPGWPTQHL